MRSGNLQAVISLLSHMEGEGGGEGEGGEGLALKVKPPGPNAGTWELLIQAHVEAGDYKGALRAIERAERANGERLRLSGSKILNLAIEMADKVGDEGAVRRLKRMAQFMREGRGQRSGLLIKSRTQDEAQRQ